MSFDFINNAVQQGNYEPEGIYLSAPYTGRYRLLQRWGENPAFYARYQVGGVPLKGHNGLDIELPKGTSVLATDDGQVFEIGYEPDGYGRFLKIEHWWGESLYAHLHSIRVEAGTRVMRGQQLGMAGKSGRCNQPHLHFAIRIEPYTRSDGWGGYTNPMPFLEPDLFVLSRSS